MTNDPRPTSSPVPAQSGSLSGPPPRPPFWLRLSIPAGNALQLAGLVLGAALLYVDARLSIGPAVRVAVMLVGWLAIYVCFHALAHYAVGRLVGIRFRAYGVRGTDHPENYPPLARQLMQALPTFTAMTEKASMQQARPVAKALMFAAGESSTAVCSILAAWYAWRSGIPGGLILFVVMIIFNAFSTVVTALVPRGDYWKAIRALRGKA
jgi:hypothetical protein